MLKIILNSIKSPIAERLCMQTLQGPLNFPNIIGVSPRYLHITSTIFGSDRRTVAGSVLKKDEGVVGEGIVDIDNVLTKDDIFPDMNTPNKLFNGIPFKEIPIVNIRCSPNNTLMSVTNFKGEVQFYNSCGCEGFKHSRKGTNIAAQATAISLGTKALGEGYKTVRVRVRGLGPGRASSIQGLQMSGMEIISITDYTPVTWTPLRPKKAKRL